MLRFAILGPVEVYDPDGAAVPLAGPRQVRLLGLLLVHADRAVSVDQLRDALWGGERSRGADKRVQMAIARLRRALDRGDDASARLRTVAGGYRLVVAPEELDSHAFEASVRAGRRALDAGDHARATDLLNEALSLWRGPALADVAYEDWAQLEIRRLDELRLDALQASAEAELALGRHTAVVSQLETLAARHWEREQLISLLMLALYRCGRQQEALDVFQRARTRLSDEVGLEPGPAVSALHQRILMHDPALLSGEEALTRGPALLPRRSRAGGVPAPPSPSMDREVDVDTAVGMPGGEEPDMAPCRIEATGAAPSSRPTSGPARTASGRRARLPMPLTSLVGREHEVGELVSVVDDGARLVTVTGPGGSGKTRLAIEAAARLLRRFSEGVVFVPLAAVSDAQLVPSQIASAAGLLTRPGVDAQEQLTGWLEQRRVLLLLDNFEHLLDAAQRVMPLLEAAPGLVVLVTSRARLRVPGEHLFACPPLAIDDAAALFVQRATDIQQGSGANGELEVVRAICQRLDGLPLAVELAAALTSVLEPQRILERLERPLALLTTGSRADITDRQRTLERAIAWSYELLDEEAQCVFRGLSVFRGGCTLQAAERVCGARVDTLRSLVDGSLLRRDAGADGEIRFWMLQTVADFAADRLHDRGEAATVGSRHAAHFVALAQQAGGALDGPDEERWLARLHAEHHNIRAALDNLLERGDRAGALTVLGKLRRFWEIHGHLDEAEHLLRRALALSGDVPSDVRGWANLFAGRLAILRWRPSAAQPSIEEALAAFEAVGDVRGIVYALGYLSWARGLEGEWDPVFEERAVALARDRGDAHTLGLALINLAQCYQFMGQSDTASGLYPEAVSLVRQTGHQRMLMLTLVSFAWTLEERHDFGECVALVREALEIDIDDLNLAECLLLLAAVERQLGQPQRAAQLCGAFQAVCHRFAIPPQPGHIPKLEAIQDSSCQRIGEQSWHRWYASGQTLALSDARALGLSSTEALATLIPTGSPAA